MTSLASPLWWARSAAQRKREPRERTADLAVDLARRLSRDRRRARVPRSAARAKIFRRPTKRRERRSWVALRRCELIAVAERFWWSLLPSSGRSRFTRRRVRTPIRSAGSSRHGSPSPTHAGLHARLLTERRASQWTSAEPARSRSPASQSANRVRARSITQVTSISAISHQ